MINFGRLFGSSARSTGPQAVSLDQSPAAIVVCGWSGAGKTEMISRLASIGANRLSVLLTELNQGSVSIDLNRLPSSVDKVGMAGCTCCQLFSEVSSRVSDDWREKKLNVIEVGPLSDPAVLLDGLRQAGIRAVGVFLFNPGQNSAAFAPAQIRGIQSADVIVVTHAEADSEFKAAKSYIESARGLEIARPYKVLANRDRRNPAYEVWSECVSILNAREITQGRSESGAPDTLSFATFQNQMKLSYSELPLTPMSNDVAAIFKAVQAFNAEFPGVIDRVKGLVDPGAGGGVDFDVITQNGDLVLNERKLPGGSASSAFISVRSYKSDLRPLLADLARYGVAVPVIDERLVSEQLAAYPNAQKVKMLVSKGDVPMKFGPDLYLRDLQVVIPEVKSADRVIQLGVAKAVVAYLKRSIEVRLDLVEALEGRSNQISKDDNTGKMAVTEGLMNAHLFLSEALFLYKNLQSYHKFSGEQVERARSLRPAEKLVHCMKEVYPLRLYGQSPLYGYQLEHLGKVIAAAQSQGAVERSDVDGLLSHLKSSRDLNVLGGLRAFQAGLNLK